MDSALAALARFRDRMRYAWPQYWPLSAASAALVFAGYATMRGVDPAGAGLAAAWLFLAGAALLLVKGQSTMQAVTEVGVAGGLFAFVALVALYQLTPGGPGLAHPMWALVDAPGAVTLDRGATLREAFKFTGLAAAFVVGAVIGRNDRRARLFFTLVLISGAVFAVMALFDAMLARAGGTAAGDAMGAVFAMVTVLGFARVLQAVREAFDRHLALTAFARAAALGMAATVAGGAALAAYDDVVGRIGVAAVVFGLTAWECRAARGRYVWAVTAMAVTGVAFAAGMFAHLALLSAAVSEPDRLASFAAYGRAILAAPVFGYGFGAFSDVNGLIQTAQNWTALDGAMTARSLYVQWLVEAGALATLAIGACVGVLMVLAARASEWRKRMRSWLRAVVVVSAWLLLDGVAGDALQAMPVALLWTALLGVAAGLAVTKTASPRRT